MYREDDGGRQANDAARSSPHRQLEMNSECYLLSHTLNIGSTVCGRNCPPASLRTTGHSEWTSAMQSRMSCRIDDPPFAESHRRQGANACRGEAGRSCGSSNG